MLSYTAIMFHKRYATRTSLWGRSFMGWKSIGSIVGWWRVFCMIGIIWVALHPPSLPSSLPIDFMRRMRRRQLPCARSCIQDENILRTAHLRSSSFLYHVPNAWMNAIFTRFFHFLPWWIELVWWMLIVQSCRFLLL